MVDDDDGGFFFIKIVVDNDRQVAWKNIILFHTVYKVDDGFIKIMVDYDRFFVIKTGG